MQVNWSEMKDHLRSIRTQVFIKEQHVPEELEWDDDDLSCIHLLAKKDNTYVATARLLKTCQIGRMAVLKQYRRCGIGSKMLEKLLSIANSLDMQTVFLNAQIDAKGFYHTFGFKEEGDIFEEAGIPHTKMTKSL